MNDPQGTIHEPTTVITEEDLALHETSRIDSFCIINATGGAVINEQSVIHAGSHLVGRGRFEMGARSVVTYNCTILTSTADLRYPASSVVPQDERRNVTDSVVLGTETFVGSGSVIMPGVTLEEGACVAANSYVDEDVPAWTVRLPNGDERPRQKATDASFGGQQS